jgi:CRISPR/Cas system-associated protein endoribonuclease Cas2
MIIRLSKDALVAQLRRSIRETQKKLPAGEQCLVLFDFPVGANAARKSLRSFLLSSGFRREQLSAWMTDQDVVLSMRALVRILGVEKWVKVFRVTET